MTLHSNINRKSTKKLAFKESLNSKIQEGDETASPDSFGRNVPKGRLLKKVIS